MMPAARWATAAKGCCATNPSRQTESAKRCAGCTLCCLLLLGAPACTRRCALCWLLARPFAGSSEACPLPALLLSPIVLLKQQCISNENIGCFTTANCCDSLNGYVCNSVDGIAEGQCV